MDKNNSIKIFLVFLIFLVIIVGGYILMRKSFDSNFFEFSKEKKEEEVINEVVDIRIDSSKEYIYFENSERIEDELDIEYKDVVINFNDNNNIASILNEEKNKLKETLEYDENNENAVYDGLIYAEYKNYEIYEYDKYISLVVYYYNYDVEDFVSYEKSKTYVFNKNTGILLSEDDLLKEYNYSKNDIIKFIKEYIDGQNLLKEEENLDSDATTQNLDSLNLYIDKLGRLTSSILVKSDKKDYNEDIIID